MSTKNDQKILIRSMNRDSMIKYFRSELDGKVNDLDDLSYIWNLTKNDITSDPIGYLFTGMIPNNTNSISTSHKLFGYIKYGNEGQIVYNDDDSYYSNNKSLGTINKLLKYTIDTTKYFTLKENKETTVRYRLVNIIPYFRPMFEYKE